MTDWNAYSRLMPFAGCDVESETHLSQSERVVLVNSVAQCPTANDNVSKRYYASSTGCAQSAITLACLIGFESFEGHAVLPKYRVGGSD